GGRAWSTRWSTASTTGSGAGPASASAGASCASAGQAPEPASEPAPPPCHRGAVLECVVNLSEGRDPARLEGFRSAVEPVLLDVHADPYLNRSVLTLAGEPDELHHHVAALAQLAVATLDLGSHRGEHPRLGVIDVVPFVDLADAALPATEQSLSARDRFADWAAAAVGLPCFLYGPDRALPDVRREAWRSLWPDRGPSQPHPTAGAVCVGARGALIA